MRNKRSIFTAIKMLPARLKYHRLEAGCDEVGRGCLAGPVVAAAVILPPRAKHVLLRDSKTLSASQRDKMCGWIKQKAIAWAIAEVSPTEIDEINILNASFLAMEKAIQELKTQPEHLLIDGNRFKSSLNYDYDCVIKGDGKYGSIAAASILAKTYRDELMTDLAIEHPAYGWESNAGYPTKKHRNAIKAFGITTHHRKSFRLLPEQLELEL